MVSERKKNEEKKLQVGVKIFCGKKKTSCIELLLSKSVLSRVSEAPPLRQFKPSCTSNVLSRGAPKQPCARIPVSQGRRSRRRRRRIEPSSPPPAASRAAASSRWLLLSHPALSQTAPPPAAASPLPSTPCRQRVKHTCPKLARDSERTLRAPRGR